MALTTIEKQPIRHPWLRCRLVAFPVAPTNAINLTSLHLLPFDKNATFLDVAIQRPQAITVIDDHRVAIAIHVVGDDHLAVLCSHNWRPFRCRNVNAVVQASFPCNGVRTVAKP